MTDVDPTTDDLLARADRWDVQDDPYFPGELIRDLAAALRAARTERDAAHALCAVYAEFIAAHDAVEHLIADCTEDAYTYNQAVKRMNAARRAVADAITQATQDDKT